MSCLPDTTLADESLTDLLARLAAPTPAPGGGSAAAVTCSLAAALVEMAAGFAGETGDSGEAGAPGARAAQLRARAVELAELDLTSYGPVLDALARDRADPERTAAVTDALSGAAAVPFELAGIAAEVAALAADVAERVGPHVVGDAVTAAVLAHAGGEAAAALVALNVTSPTDDRPVQAAQWCSDADKSRRQLLAKVHGS